MGNQGNKGNKALFFEWESRLAAEGLAHLDYALGVGNKGSGKAAGSGAILPEEALAAARAQAARREETAAVMAWRAEVLHAFRFPSARDRRIWELHAEGIGTKEIAAKLRHGRRTVVASIATTTTAARKRSQRRVDPVKAIRTAAPDFLAALWRCFA